jgi:thiamine pyrophosphate-dependent acetolactate synthase large subunit-like protein
MSDASRGNQLWSSDPIAQMLRDLQFDYIALTPGASFRGLHDSLVNYLGNTKPKILLCLHEEHAVSIAHGYARVTGRPMAVALHSNVGLMHATMAIFNAWVDRVPIFMLGAVGPVDAVQRRPWVDWIHTASDLGALVRGYTKWDNQPASIPSTLESMVRAYQIAMTAPRGPVYVCLDAAMQEHLLDAPPETPPLARFGVPSPLEPASEAVAAATEALTNAKAPLILMGRVTSDREDWTRRVALAERLEANVLTDIKNGAVFPTTHRLHPSPPALYVGEAGGALIREADVILALDWIDLGGTLKQAGGGAWPTAQVISCSPEQLIHNGYSMDYQMLPPTEVNMLASPDRLVRRLMDTLGGKPANLARQRPARTPAPPPATAPDISLPTGNAIRIDDFAGAIARQLASEAPSYIRLPLGWPGEHCRFEDPLDYIGFDGGGGLASGPGMAIGAALALKGSGRLPVAILGDGDFLMGCTALWTGVHWKTPVLVIVANNRSFFNDELHQERMARVRGRPVENKGIGIRMEDPPADLAKMAEGQGAVGIGPIETLPALQEALRRGVEHVRAGKVCVLDVIVAPEYARVTSAGLLRKIPTG